MYRVPSHRSAGVVLPSSVLHSLLRWRKQKVRHLHSVGWLVGSCNRAFRAITRGNCGVGGKELGRGRMEGVLNRPQRAHECGEGGTRSGGTALVPFPLLPPPVDNVQRYFNVKGS